MNKIKLLLGCGSLAFSMLTAGCGDKKCADYSKEEDCKNNKEDDVACVWEKEDGSDTKGTCKKGASTNNNDSNSGGTQQNNAAEVERLNKQIEDLKNNRPALQKVCTLDVSKDFSKICSPDDADAELAKELGDATDDAAKNALCQSKRGSYCSFEAMGKCETNKLVALAAGVAVGAETQAFGIGANGKSWEHSDYLLLNADGGTAASVFKAGGVEFADAYNDPCNAATTFDACSKLGVTLSVAAVNNQLKATALLDNVDSKINKVMACSWTPGREVEHGCMFDGSKLADAAKKCDDFNANPGQLKCGEGELSHCKEMVPNEKALSAPAATPASNEGATNNMTGGNS